MKATKKITYRPATIEDFKKGQILYTKEGWSFSLVEKYGEGMWNAREGKVIYEGNVNLYRIANN